MGWPLNPVESSGSCGAGRYGAPLWSKGGLYLPASQSPEALNEAAGLLPLAGTSHRPQAVLQVAVSTGFRNHEERHAPGDRSGLCGSAMAGLGSHRS